MTCNICERFRSLLKMQWLQRAVEDSLYHCRFIDYLIRLNDITGGIWKAWVFDKHRSKHVLYLFYESIPMRIGSKVKDPYRILCFRQALQQVKDWLDRGCPDA